MWRWSRHWWASTLNPPVEYTNTFKPNNQIKNMRRKFVSLPGLSVKSSKEIKEVAWNLNMVAQNTTTHFCTPSQKISILPKLDTSHQFENTCMYPSNCKTWFVLFSIWIFWTFWFTWPNSDCRKNASPSKILPNHSNCSCSGSCSQVPQFHWPSSTC